MGDFLELRVIKADPREGCTGLILKGDVRFMLPVKVNLKKGDKLRFYQGHITNIQNHFISHDNYLSIDVYRGKTELFTFEARDMRLLSQVRKDYVD